MRPLAILLLVAGCADRSVDLDEINRGERVFAVDAIDVRVDRAASFDFDADGEPDDQLSQVIGGLFAWNSDLRAAAIWAIETGAIRWQLALRDGAMSFQPSHLEQTIEIPVLVGEPPLSIPVRGLRVEHHATSAGHISGRLGGVVPGDAIATTLVPEIARLINARIAVEASDSEIAPLLANLDWGGAGCANANDRNVEACELAEQPFWKRTLGPDVDGGLSFSLGFGARQR